MSATQKKNLNEATRKDIQNLPFMNQQRAELIIHYRENNGPFQSLADLDDVPGIGTKLSSLVAGYFTVGPVDTNEGGGHDTNEDNKGRRAR
jgi:competence protein ComEA